MREDPPTAVSVRTPSPRTPASRPVAALLRDRVFGPFFLGQIVATIAVWIHNVATAIVVWELSRSTALVAAITVSQFAPQFLLSPLSGAHADRSDRRRQLVTGTLITASGTGGLAVWSATIGLAGTPGALAVVLAAAVVGTGFAVGGPAAQALLPSLVRDGELPSAIAISTVPMTIARALGPALGALLITTTGPTVTFTVTTTLQLTYALTMFRRERDTNARDGRDTRIRTAVAYVLHDRPVAWLLVGIVVVGLGVDPVITLSPAIADSLGGAGDTVGLLTSAFGVGALLGFGVQPTLRRRAGIERSGTAGLLVLATGLALWAVAPTPALAASAMVVAGIGMTLSLTAFTTGIQQRVPDDLRGRVMALWSMAFLGSRPIAAALSGALADLGGEELALAVAVTIVLLGAVASRPAHTRATGPRPHG